MTAADGLVGLRALPLPDYGRVVGAHEEPRHELAADELGDHMDRLYRAAWALCGSREDAEDLVQDTYTRVLARPRFLRRDHDHDHDHDLDRGSHRIRRGLHLSPVSFSSHPRQTT
jgi:hypothetical protein